MDKNTNRSFKNLELSQGALKNFLTDSKYLGAIKKYDIMASQVETIKNVQKDKKQIISIFEILDNQIDKNIIFPDVVNDLERCINSCANNHILKNSNISKTKNLTKLINSYNKFYPEDTSLKEVRLKIRSIADARNELSDLLKVHMKCLSVAKSIYDIQGKPIEIFSDIDNMRKDVIEKKYIYIDQPIYIDSILKGLQLKPYNTTIKDINTKEELSDFINFFGEDIIPEAIQQLFMDIKNDDSELSIDEILEELDYYSYFDKTCMGNVATDIKNSLTEEQVEFVWMLQGITMTSKIIIIESSELTSIIKNNSKDFLAKVLLPRLNNQIWHMYKNTCLNISTASIIDNKNSFYKKYNLGNEEHSIVYGVTYNQTLMDLKTDATCSPFITIEEPEQLDNIMDEAIEVKNILRKLLGRIKKCT